MKRFLVWQNHPTAGKYLCNIHDTEDAAKENKFKLEQDKALQGQFEIEIKEV